MSTIFGDNGSALNPSLAKLFSNSAGPVAAPSHASTVGRPSQTQHNASDEEDVQSVDNDAELSSLLGSGSDSDDNESEAEDEEEPTKSDGQSIDSDAAFEDAAAELTPPPNSLPQQNERKRKRKNKDDEHLESTYLAKLAREEEVEAEQLRAEREHKRQKLERDVAPVHQDSVESNENSQSVQRDEDTNSGSPPPLHETLTPTDAENTLDKASRTVFLGNVSTTAITSKTSRKELLTHLSSFFPSLPQTSSPPKLESLRFRSTAYATTLPKKAAFTRRVLKESTSKSTNAYVVYSSKPAAREAAKRLNGTIVLGRHLRVDELAHPMKIDHRRCVFVGNVGFVDDETELKESQAASDHPEDQKKSKSKPLKGDAEEGLWQQFGKAGKVESVRVVRDAKTRVGKGFAYVQFTDENAVESALLFDGKKFPPLLPRKLRVTRCRKPSQTAGALQKVKTRDREAVKEQRREGGAKTGRGTGSNRTEVNQDAMHGRLKKMLGRAGVAEMRASTHGRGSKRGKDGFAPLVFEGQRASASQGNQGLKLAGAKKKKSKGQTSKRQERSDKRAAAYKKNKQ